MSRKSSRSIRRSTTATISQRRLDVMLRKALAEHHAGHLVSAEAAYEKVLSHDPDQAQALHYLGMLCHQTGRTMRAVELLDAAVRLKPDPVTHNNLGSMLLEQERIDEAIKHYLLAVKVKPDYVSVHFNLGTLLQGSGDIARATFHFERVVELTPDDWEGWNNLGLMLMEAENQTSASGCFRRAIELNADYAQAYNNLGCALMNTGDIDTARLNFIKAIELDPAFARAYENLVRSRRMNIDAGDWIKRMHDNMNLHNVSDASLAIFNFALGKIYDDCEDYSQAFKHYRAGNELVKKRTPYNRDSTEQYIGNIISTFSADFLTSRRGAGHSSSKPVFIIGMPRSGSTLVEQIISAHHQVHGAGELTFIDDMTHAVPAVFGGDTHYPECVKLLESSQVRKLAEQYLANFDSLDFTLLRITDKLLGNFMHVGFIKLLFPNARFIHCRRNPMGVCLSIYFQRFASKHDYAYDLIDIGTYYRQYEGLMQHWREIPGLDMMEIEYEKLVSDPELYSHRLVEFCGLAWDPACLEFYENKRTVRTASNWQVRQPVYSQSAGRWRYYEQHLTELKDELRETGVNSDALH